MSELTCGVCGGAARAAFRAPQPEIAPDLDMRPGEPTRSTLRTGSRSAPKCGAAAPDLAALPAAARAVVESDDYRMLSTTVLEETLPFRRWALICEHAGDRAQQAEALLQAAWAADDAAAMTEPAKLRTEVAALWDGYDGCRTGAAPAGRAAPGGLVRRGGGLGDDAGASAGRTNWRGRSSRSSGRASRSAISAGT